jgi:hypothetical protein
MRRWQWLAILLALPCAASTTTTNNISDTSASGVNSAIRWHYDQAGRCNLPTEPPQFDSQGIRFPPCKKPFVDLPPGQHPTIVPGQRPSNVPFNRPNNGPDASPPPPPPRRPQLGLVVGLAVGGTVVVMTVLLLLFTRHKRRRNAAGVYQRLEAQLEVRLTSMLACMP